jgi:hypothetical protein
MQKDKQRFRKHAHKTKDRVTRTQLRQGVISGVSEGQTVPQCFTIYFAILFILLKTNANVIIENFN